MSVRPVEFNTDGSIDVVYDEMGHSGTIPAAEIVWTVSMDGNPNHEFIVLACPDGCGATSTHPAGGGAAPIDVQQMFARKVQRDGCPCGAVGAGDNTSLPEAHTRLNCSRMDGPARWQGETPPVEPDGEGPPRLPIVYRLSDRLVVGEHPRGGVGPANRVAVIELAEYEILLRTNPAYITEDDHIVGTPP